MPPTSRSMAILWAAHLPRWELRQDRTSSPLRRPDSSLGNAKSQCRADTSRLTPRWSRSQTSAAVIGSENICIEQDQKASYREPPTWIIAEVGPTVATVPSAKCLSSWVGACPGDDESAGVNYSNRSPQGKRHMHA